MSKGSTVQASDAQAAMIEPIDSARQPNGLPVRLHLDFYATRVLVVR